MSLIIEYSWWFFLLCLLLGVGYAFLLYYKNKNIIYGKTMRIIMASLRGTVITLIVFLLLAPMLKFLTKQKEKPIIVVAVDNSESLKLGKDSSFYINKLTANLNQLIHSFGNNYNVRPCLIGEKVRFLQAEQPISLDYSDKQTNISEVFDNVAQNYTNQNLGAVILLTDGIFNVGANPFYKIEPLNCPIYTVGLGNTELETDQLISSIQHNKQTFQGNFFPVEVNVMATKLAGKKSLLTVEDKEGNEVFKKELMITGDNYFETVRFNLQAGEKGIYRYHVNLIELENEMTYKNNHATFFVEVIDSKEKIAIIYNSPHPDIAAIKQALELSDKYEVEAVAAQNFRMNPEDYSLIILHQLPSLQNNISSLLSDIQNKGISCLYILGKQTNLTAFNKLNSGVLISQNKTLFNDAFPLLNNNFSLFTLSEDIKQIISTFPPLYTFFGDYKLTVSSNVLMYQKINTVSTDYPLIFFNQVAGRKIGVITGDGIWQWKIHNFIAKNNHEQFNELINKMALFLSVKADRSFFRVHTKNLFNETEDVRFSAELYNESYELISEPDVLMTISSEDGKQYKSLFSKEENHNYSLRMSNLPSGEYHWEASTNIGAKNYLKTGTFVVKEVELEIQNLVADHELLQNIAQKSGGEFYTPNNMDQLVEDIKKNDEISSIVSYHKIYNHLLNSWLYFVVLILLMGSEWFLRKWGGGY